MVGGFFAFRALDIEAYPNPVPPLVEVIAQPARLERRGGRALRHHPARDRARGHARPRPRPLAVALRAVRREVLLQVGHRLRAGPAGGHQPPAVRAAARRASRPSSRRGTPSARSSATGCAGKGYSLARAQDRAGLDPGAAVQAGARASSTSSSFGGETKQYHVEVDPYRLRGLRRHPRAAAARRSATPTRTSAASGSPSASSPSRSAASGSSARTRDIGDVVVTAAEGRADPRARRGRGRRWARRPRLGIVGQNDDADVVQGIVLMRYGGATRPDARGHPRAARGHQATQPPAAAGHGDRAHTTTAASWSQLTTHTVMENLLVGMGLVTLVLCLLPRATAGGARSPRSTSRSRCCVAFCGMVAHRHAGEPHLARRRRLRHRGRLDGDHDGEHLPPPGRARHGRHAAAHPGGGRRGRRGRCGFSTLIIAVAFLPLFTMTGVSGVIFSPMARHLRVRHRRRHRSSR